MNYKQVKVIRDYVEKNAGFHGITFKKEKAGTDKKTKAVDWRGLILPKGCDLSTCMIEPGITRAFEKTDLVRPTTFVTTGWYYLQDYNAKLALILI